LVDERAIVVTSVLKEFTREDNGTLTAIETEIEL
jgi:hypothetical protein